MLEQEELIEHILIHSYKSIRRKVRFQRFQRNIFNGIFSTFSTEDFADLLLRNPDFLVKNPDFLLKNVDFII